MSGSDSPDFFILKYILSAKQSRRKRELLQHVSTVDASIQDTTSQWKSERYERELYHPVPPERDYCIAPPRDAWKTYDDRGLANVQCGRCAEAIFFRDHYAPLAEAFFSRSQEMLGQSDAA